MQLTLFMLHNFKTLRKLRYGQDVDFLSVYTTSSYIVLSVAVPPTNSFEKLTQTTLNEKIT